METITTTYTVYKYQELSENAKEKVRQWYLDGMEGSEFTDIVEEILFRIFPNSNLTVQYSLGYCQGDGLNIYGELNLLDMLEQTKHGFTDKEYKRLRYYFTTFGDIVRLEANTHYCYCIADRYAYTDCTLNEMERRGIRDIDTNLLNKFDAHAARTFTELCSQYETVGYKYFYEVDEDVLIECCEANNWRFLKDGRLFASE